MNEVRVGNVIDSPMGIFTRWLHLKCAFFHDSIKSASDLDGYATLDSESQKLLQDRVEKSKLEIDPDSAAVDPNELVRKDWSEEMDAPSELLMPLLPFQKEGLGWMVHQENTNVSFEYVKRSQRSLIGYHTVSQVKGGILADEMGMGKTIQAVSLILANKPIRTSKGKYSDSLIKAWDESDSRHDIKPGSLRKAGTLVVLPTVAIRQWQTEIFRYTKQSSLSVVVYHGSGRAAELDQIFTADVVLTSYKILESEYRKATAGTKVECRICGRKFYPEKLRLHRKYFCGETAQRTAGQSKTQKKSFATAKSRRGQSGRVLDSDDDDEEEDEVDRQKRMIKAMKQGKPTVQAGSKKGAPTTRKSIPGKASAGNELDSESEDEVDRQKKKIKALAAARDKKAAAKGKSAPSKSSTPRVKPSNVKPDAPANIIDDSDDDVVYIGSKGKRTAHKGRGNGVEREKLPQSERARPTRVAATDATARMSVEGGARGSAGQHTPTPSATRSAPSTLSTSKKRAGSGSRNGSRSTVKQLESDSDSDDDFVAEDSDDEDEDEDEDELSDASDTLVTKKRKLSSSTSKSIKSKSSAVVSKADPKSSSKDSRIRKRGAIQDSDDDESEDESEVEFKKSRGTKVKSKVTSSKRKTSRSDSDEDGDASDGLDEDEDDEEVERDIAAALKAASKKPATQSPLHQASWLRVVLDEAHMVKDRSSSTAKAVFNLVSLYKWCLTGTPLQNRVGELYSLVRFLRIDPHAFYFCKKGCPCKSLHYRFSKGKCLECGHIVMSHYCHFNRHILNPIKRCGYVAEGRKAMLKLKEQVLDEILLRRTKETRADDIQLPPRIVRVRQEAMDEREDDFYQALYTQSQAQFDTYVASGTVLNNYAHIFDILIRLRQAVDHPYLVIHSDSSATRAASASARPVSTYPSTPAPAEEEDLDCCVCHDPADVEGSPPSRAACGHVFCSRCLSDLLDSAATQSTVCPCCSRPLTISAVRTTAVVVKSRSRSSFIDKIDLSKFQSSTKLEELEAMRAKDPGAKALVFSQFVNMLDLVEYRLSLGGIKGVKLVGNLSLDQRDKAVKSFREDPAVTALLISLKAGGVALNLTVSNYVFLMDPWWNPAAEMQAIDRTHRIGQHRPIYATRIIVRDSIEARLLALQQKKKLVFDGTVGGDSSSMARLTVDDMRFLFQ